MFSCDRGRGHSGVSICSDSAEFDFFLNSCTMSIDAVTTGTLILTFLLCSVLCVCFPTLNAITFTSSTHVAINYTLQPSTLDDNRPVLTDSTVSPPSIPSILIRFTLTPSASKNELGQPSSWSCEKKALSKKNIDFTSVNTKVSTLKVRERERHRERDVKKERHGKGKHDERERV